MTTILAYLGLSFSAYSFTIFTWNRCAALSGLRKNETWQADLVYVIATPWLAWSLKHLF